MTVFDQRALNFERPHSAYVFRATCARLGSRASNPGRPTLTLDRLLTSFERAAAADRQLANVKPAGLRNIATVSKAA